MSLSKPTPTLKITIDQPAHEVMKKKEAEASFLTRVGEGCYSSALVMSSTTFLPSPNTIMVLSM